MSELCLSPTKSASAPPRTRTNARGRPRDGQPRPSIGSMTVHSLSCTDRAEAGKASHRYHGAEVRPGSICAASDRPSMRRYDRPLPFHRSDGLLAPADVRPAFGFARGVSVLALTDHDEPDGLAEAQEDAREASLEFVCGSSCRKLEGAAIHVMRAAHRDPLHALIAGARSDPSAGAKAVGARSQMKSRCGIQRGWEGARRPSPASGDLRTHIRTASSSRAGHVAR